MSISLLPRRSAVRMAFATLAGLAAAPFASADVMTGDSNAYFASANVEATVVGNTLPIVTVAPLVPVSGGAPPIYTTNNTLATANVSLGAFAFPSPALPLVSGQVLGLNAATISSDAASNVDGGAGVRTTSAANTVANIGLTVLSYSAPVVGSGSLVSITGTVLSTSASVSGDYGALVGTGAASVANLSITILGQTFSFSGPIAANTTVNTGIAGVTLILNEQVQGGDGVSSRTMTTNLVHLSLDGVGIAGVASVDADVVLGHAFASQTAVAAAIPEPSSLALAGLGLAGIAGARLRARRKAA
jgi:hypothetical protein